MSDLSCHSLTLLGHGHMLLCCTGELALPIRFWAGIQKLPVEA
ncbi:hypothetical protein [Paenibacillus xylanexedens]|nr:hypothetical protein [Paenibacillus xylanexedens]